MNIKRKLLFIFLITLNCTAQKPIGLDFEIKGEGSPIIIFENGMASTYETWKNIPEQISKTNRVLLYNRSGLGNSQNQKGKRTIPNMVSDLEKLIDENQLNGPFILVAHSMGSYLSRYFALQHPEKVAGILLIDPSPDKMYDAYSNKETEDFLSFGYENFKNSSEAVKKEWENYLPNRKYVQAKLLDAIPVVVLSASQWDFYQYHTAILNNNNNSRHLKIQGSHDLHHEFPELIIEQIQYLINLH